MIRLPPRSQFFPYTTLLRSCFATDTGCYSAYRGDHLCPSQGVRGPARAACLHVEWAGGAHRSQVDRSEEHTSELQSLTNLVCRLLLEKKKQRSHILY